MSIFAVSITFSFIDNKAKTSSTKVRIPTGLTIAQITTFAQSAAQLFADFSNCQLTSVKACIGVDLSGLGLATSADANSDVAEKAFFGLRTAGNTYAKSIMPTIAEAYVSPGTDVLDVTNVDVAAVITAFEDGIVTAGGLVNAVDLRGNDIVEVNLSNEMFRKFTGS